MTEEYTELYEKRKKIQPLMVAGFFQSIRNYTIIATLSLYFISPWLNWNHRQAVLFDLPGRKFYIWGFTFWPQDFFFLSGILIMSALGLFLVTVVAGRVWCGYTCPQTVWTKLFLMIEQFVEGGRSQRLKLDKAPMSVRKFALRFTKHVLWILLALATAITFVGFFSPIRELVLDLLRIELNGWETFWIGFFTLATYVNAGWMREQVCLTMCPYARFQSVMFDRDTMIISYDYNRGEPRGPRSKKADPKELELGACINCHQCVHACPTGIDIRDGLQMQCIGCAACIDACDRIMDKMGYARGLVRYTTERNLEEDKASQLIRTRTIAYTLVITVLFTTFMTTLFMRSLVDVDVIRDRNQLFRVTDMGLIENVYQIKIMNKSQKTQTYLLSTSQPLNFVLQGDKEITLAEGEIGTVLTSIQADQDKVYQQNSKIDIVVTNKETGREYHEETRFLMP